MRIELALCAALAASCASAPPARVAEEPAAPRPDALVAALRDRLKASHEVQAELYWKSWTTGELPEQPASRLPPLGPETLAAIDAAQAQTTDPLELRRLRLLRAHVAAEAAARATSPASDALAQALAEASFEGPDGPVALRELDRLLSREAHAGRRQEAEEAAREPLRSILAVAAERDRQLFQALRELGVVDARAFAGELRQADLQQTAALAERLLEETDALWRQGVQELGRARLERATASPRRADLPRALRSGDVDGCFRAEQMVPRIRELMDGAGLGPARLTALRIDAEPGEARRPRALALPIALPGEVRLSLSPAGGLEALAQALHETGHGVQLALIREEGFELAHFGHEAMGETLAYLFEGLVGEPRLAEVLGLPAEKRDAHVRLAALRRLLAARVAAGRFICDFNQLPSGPPGPSEGAPDVLGQAEACQRVMERAWGAALPPELAMRHLADGEALLASADRLRGMVAAAQLEAQLAARFPEGWWRDSGSVEVYAALCAAGGRETLDEALARVGIEALDPKALAGLVEARLGATAELKAPVIKPVPGPKEKPRATKRRSRRR